MLVLTFSRYSNINIKEPLEPFRKSFYLGVIVLHVKGITINQSKNQF